jgi:mannan polymerase II complex ANP1 subunit
MEQERKAREQEEKERAERMKKIKDQFADPNGQWEKDKSDIQSEAMKEKAKEQEKGGVTEKAATGDSKGAAVPAAAEAAKPQEPAEVRQLESFL